MLLLSRKYIFLYYFLYWFLAPDRHFYQRKRCGDVGRAGTAIKSETLNFLTMELYKKQPNTTRLTILFILLHSRGAEGSDHF